MKRKFSIGLAVVVIVTLMLTSVASGASTTKNLSTNFTLVNLSGTDATGTIDYIQPDGTTWAGSSYTAFGPGSGYDLHLPANGQLVVRQYGDTLDSGQGSVVVSSDVELGAVVQLRLPPGSTSLPTSSAYLGGSSGSSKFYLPMVQSRRSTSTGMGNTQVMIQNVGSSEIDGLKVNFLAEAGSGSTPSTYQKNIDNLQPGATYFYDLADETNLNAGWTGSAEVDAGSSKVLVVVNSFNGPDALRTYNGFAEESINPKWSIPLFYSKLTNGLNSSVSVQNLSGGTIAAGDLDLNCGSFSMSNNAPILDRGSFSFNPISNAPEVFPDNWQGACTVDAGSADVVVFVILRRIVGNGDQAAYEAISYATTSTKALIPLAAKRLANGFATSITIVNLAAEDAVVDLIWTPSEDECQVSPCQAYTEDAVTIPANGSLVRNLRVAADGPMPSGWQGTLMVVPDNSANAKPISGYVILSSLVSSKGDNYRAHIALELP